MNKIPKYVVIIACILAMVVLLPLGYVRYKTRYEAEQISVSTSPDGDYELVIYSVGDPDFPFGAAHGRLVLKGKEKTVAYRSFEVANDGARFYDGDLETTWYIDRVEVVVSGSEQRDELVTMRFNGQTSSRRLTTRYRREDTDIEKDSEQDSAITEKASGDSRENAESSTDSSVDPDVNDQPENKEITVGYQAIFEKYSDATAGKFEVYYGASESSSRCILSESDNSVEYIVYDGKSENGKCGLYVRYRTEKGGGGTYDYGSAEVEDIYAYVFSSGEVISSGKTNWEDTGTDEFERATE